MTDVLDIAVVGAGLRGLHAARQAQLAGRTVQAFDAATEPGGAARTLRSEGFVCELGDFALAAPDWAEHARALTRPPAAQSLRPTACTGAVWNGSHLVPTAVDGQPCSGVTGLSDLAVAYRRELGAVLQLGRGITAVAPLDGGFAVTLGGEVPRTLQARSVVLCSRLDAAAGLVGGLDPALAATAGRLRRVPHAFAFLGTWQDAAAEQALRGFGVRVEAPGPVRELLFCTNAFARRAVAGKALVRVELAGDALAAAPLATDDDAVAALAEADLRAITGWTGTLLFRRVHRGDALIADGAHTEATARLRDLCRRVGSLQWLPD